MNTFYAILVAILAVIVAICTVVLISYLASKKQGLSSEENYVKHLLPGIDCGACGCKSCAEFAKRVAAHERDADGCKVNTFRNRQKLSRHFEKPIDRNVKRVAFVRCKGGTKCELKYDYVGENSCSACEKLHSGKLACKAGCLGCGDCVKACPYGAIFISERGVAEVNASKCTGCGRCTRTCPNKLIELISTSQKVNVVCNNTFDDKGITKICSVGCVRCEACVNICPHGAIRMENNLPVIDPAKCTNCGRCVASCPTKVISHL